MSTRARRALSSLAVATVAVGAAAAPAMASPAGHRDHRPGRQAAAPAFQVVKEAPGATSIAALPSGGVLVASIQRTVDPFTSKVEVNRYQDGRWTSLPVPSVVRPARIDLSASGPRDIWLTSGMALYHSTGGAFTEVHLPGYGFTVEQVIDVPGPDVYVTSSVGRLAAVLYRYDGTRWTTASNVEGQALRTPLATAWNRTPMVPVKLATRTDAGVTLADGLFSFTNGALRKVAPVNEPATSMYGPSFTGRAAVAESATSATVYGYEVKGSPSGSQLSGAARGARPLCGVPFAITGADRLANGTTVLGGTDTRALGIGSGDTQGRFALHRLDGSVQVVGGDPGDTTLQVDAARGSNVAWALTATGSTRQLQRLDASRLR